MQKVNIGPKRTLTYVLEALSRFNRGLDELALRGAGQTMAKATETARILNRRFGVELADTEIGNITTDGYEISTLQASVHSTEAASERNADLEPEKLDKENLIDTINSFYVPFPVYHLLIDALLSTHGEIEIYGDAVGRKPAEPKPRDAILRITPTDDGFRCTRGSDLEKIANQTKEHLFDVPSGYQDDLQDHRVSAGLQEKFDQAGAPISRESSIETIDEGAEWKISMKNRAYIVERDGKKLHVYDIPTIKEKDITDGLISAFQRCGLLLSDRWKDVSLQLGQYDAVVLGLDTNVLRKCSFSHQLLDGFTLTTPFGSVHSPNWVLLVIPNAVMHEVEQQANDRAHGALTMRGRMGYRALQEILELDQYKDVRGLALLIVGEADPVLDTRVELRGLRRDLLQSEEERSGTALGQRMSAGDTLIRDQFKHFLRQLGFHKGAYFLTQDKSNSALAQAEGLHTIYYPPPAPDSIKKMDYTVDAPRIDFNPEPVSIHLPIGKLIYELAVQYGRIVIKAGDTSTTLSCDYKGDSLDRWVERELCIPVDDFEELRSNYGAVGKFSLEYVLEQYNDINKELVISG